MDFIVENGLQDDVQVFPLSVLPGTTFRTDSVSLGLRYEPEPPYPVIATGTFSEQELLMAFDYAESRLATCLYPLPDLNIAWRIDRRHRLKNCRDICVLIGKDRFVCKLVVSGQRPLSEIEQIAHYLTHPYQIFIGPEVNDQRYLHRMLEILTAANPFIPLELVFLEPAASPDTAAMLDAVCLERPHFLDHEQRYLFATPGNRSVLFTLVSDDASLRFQHDMQRQVYWWRHKRLPSLGDIESLSTLDGILVDPPLPGHHVFDWQHRFSQYADDYLHVGFADLKLQKRWMQLTGANDIYLGALTYSMSKEYSLP